MLLLALGIFFIYPRYNVEMTLRYFYYPKALNTNMQRPILNRQVTPIRPSEQSSQISYQKVSFVSPWGQPIEDKVVHGGLSDRESKVLRFSNNITLTESYFPLNTLISPADFIAKPLDNSRSMVTGEKALTFELKRMVFLVQPDQIKLWTLPDQAQKIASLLILKNADDDYITQGNIYYFETNVVKGFQAGKPGQDKVIILNLYDKQGNLIRINLLGQAITQEEVDTLLNSIHIGV
jgi:hypothetical protein